MSDDPVKDEGEEALSVPSDDLVRMRLVLRIEIDYELPGADAEGTICEKLPAKLVEVFKDSLDIEGAKKTNAGVSVERFFELEE